MKKRARTVLAVVTVGLIGGLSLTAAALNPPGSRTWLVVCGIVAAALSVQAVSSEPRDLLPAILLALMPVAGLASEGAPSWLGLPFAGLLLVAGELGALTWEGPAAMVEDGSLVPRVREAVIIAVLGVGIAVLLGAVAHTGLLRGTWAVVAASAAIVGVGLIVFPHVSHGSRDDGGPAPR